MSSNALTRFELEHKAAEDLRMQTLEERRNAAAAAVNRKLNAHDDLVAALTDAERIITAALYNKALSGQRGFEAEAHIGGIRAALAKAQA